MDRNRQLSNVAFGGAWSEAIPRRERMALSISLVQEAAQRTVEEDLRLDPGLEAALQDLCALHPKGAQLGASWARALAHPEPAIRQRELTRLAAAFSAWLSPEK